MRLRAGVLAFAALLFFWDLGGHDLWAPDEPYFAEGAREMVADGEWAVPHVNGRVTTDKPPLFFWLIALFSLPFGTVTELTARLPSALAGIGSVALTMRLGARLHGAKIGALAGAVLATTYLFWEKSRWSQIDALLCCLIWVALSAFEAHHAGDADGRRAGLLFWLAAALAVLAKGPVGLLLPLGIALAFLATKRELGRWRGFAPVAGPALFATVIGLWMVVATVGGGGEYSVFGALREHFVDRAVHGMHHRQPFWYFAETLPPNLLPWTLLVPGAVVLAWRRRGDGDRLALVTAAFVLLFFTISTEKRELYALPSLPAFALLIAALVGSVMRWQEAPAISRRWVTAAQGGLGGLLLLVGLALPAGAARRPEVGPGIAWALAAVVGSVGLATLFSAARGRALRSVVVPGVGVAAAYLVAVSLVYPLFESRKSGRPFARAVQSRVEGGLRSGLPLLTYEAGNVPKSIAFYTGGLYSTETPDTESLARHLDRVEPAWALVDARRLDPLPEALRSRLWVAERTELARRPLLLLVNRPIDGGEPLVDPPAAQPDPDASGSAR